MTDFSFSNTKHGLRGEVAFGESNGQQSTFNGELAKRVSHVVVSNDRGTIKQTVSL